MSDSSQCTEHTKGLSLQQEAQKVLLEEISVGQLLMSKSSQWYMKLQKL